jgi:hypothetical protein
MKAILIAAATLSAFALSPASAAMMTCTSANMAKTATAMNTMQDGPTKMERGKHMALANAAISKGDMRGGCKHYMMAQKAGGMK